jgi:hypothetical protein
MSTEPTRITPADIEAKFREVQGQIDVVADDSKKRLTLVGAVLGILALFIVYVLGRRTGKRKSTVVEIRRL